MIVLIDSRAWVDFFEGSKSGAQVREYVMDEDLEIIVSSINLAEIYRIALDRFDEAAAEKRRRSMLSRCFLIVLYFVKNACRGHCLLIRREKNRSFGSFLPYSLTILASPPTNATFTEPYPCGRGLKKLP